MCLKALCKVLAITFLSIQPLQIASAGPVSLVEPLHDFHISMLVVEVNPNTGAWELSVKLFQDDLEMALTGDFNGLELTSSSASAKVETYLREHLQLLTNDVKPLKWKWVGSETEGDALWVYLELPKAKATQIKAIKATYLQHLYSDQVNMINLMSGPKVVTLASHKGNSVVTVN